MVSVESPRDNIDSRLSVPGLLARRLILLGAGAQAHFAGGLDALITILAG